MKSYNTKIKKNPKVELVMVSKDRDLSAAAHWAKKERFPWPTVLPADSQGLLASKYFRGGVPTYVLVNKDGKAVAYGKRNAFEKINSL